MQYLFRPHLLNKYGVTQPVTVNQLWPDQHLIKCLFVIHHKFHFYAQTSVLARYYRKLHVPETENYLKYFKALNIQANCDQTTARDAFIKLAKKYHPDSGHPLANSEKFKEIDIAYRKLLEKFHNYSKEGKDCEGEYGLYYEQNKTESDAENKGKIHDIEHTAPQHRQYLGFEGIGFGNPSQRQDQYTKYRAMQASDSVINYKVKQLYKDSDETSLTTKERKAAKKIRTRYGIERIVEDKIQESMARGDFDNLPNAGKPLKHTNHNPFVDTVTFKLNEVMINNGYAPEWVMLDKEIREEKAKLLEDLRRTRSKLGPAPLSEKEQFSWNEAIGLMQPRMKELNRKIDKYNFVVPIMTNQTVHVSLNQLGEKIKNEPPRKSDQSQKEKLPPASKEEGGLRALISLFRGR